MPEPHPGDSVAALSQFLVGDRNVEDTLHRIAELATDAIAPVDVVGLTLLVEGRHRTAVFTDPMSPEIDQAQYDSGEGPCLQAFETGQVVAIASIECDDRFPAFRAAAAARGIRSTLSLPLIAGQTRLGAMNLYASIEHGFSPADALTARAFAVQSAIVLANAQAYWDAHDLGLRLHGSMDQRAIIEQAKGVLMGAQHCTADAAFEVLVAASQRENRKVRAIAQRIVDRASTARPARRPGSTGTTT